MFTHLSHFSFKRTPLQALGFYIVFVLLGLIGGAIIGALTVALYGSLSTSAYSLIVGLSILFAVVLCVVTTYSVLKAKHLRTWHISIGYLLLALIMSIVGGVLLGLIPVAYLTTKADPHTTVVE